MTPTDRIHIPPKRGRIPRKYRLGLDPPSYRWRAICWVLLGCAALSGMIWLGLT